MTTHSSLVGGSTADRLLNCPGSFQAILALPASLDVSSEYANEGTAMHEVMTRLMNIRLASYHAHKPFNAYAEAQKLIGIKFYDRVLTPEHNDTMISPALEQLERLEEHYGGDFVVAGVEVSAEFPGIPGAFGTCDLVLQSAKFVLHVDWKFGQGIGVRAVYKAGDGERVNAQLLFYCAGVMNIAKRVYAERRGIALAIIQPRGDTPLSHVQISRKEVKWFIEDLQEAAALATSRDPLRQKGEWCRFAPCKVNCPLWTGPLLELTALQASDDKHDTRPIARVTPYGAYLSAAKRLVDQIAMFKKEIDEQLHTYLESGGLVPGWRLKAKSKNRQWIDDDTVDLELRRLGFQADEIWRSQLQTFQSADATAKRLGVKIPDHLRVAPPSNETTIATTDDPAPVIDRARAIAEFAETLKALGSPSA